MEGTAADHAPHAEQIGFLKFAVDLDGRLEPVHLGLAAPRVGLWDEGFGVFQAQSEFPLADVLADGGFGGWGVGNSARMRLKIRRAVWPCLRGAVLGALR